MNSPASAASEKFDDYADDYDAALAQGLAVTGESKEYFARGRVEWLRACFNQKISTRRASTQAASFKPRDVLDFGCGTGSATPYLLETLGCKSLTGVDVSPRSLAVARTNFGDLSPKGDAARVRFELRSDYRPQSAFDLAFCNGVFHHIPLTERAAAAHYVFEALRPGGWFALWENNPWNPGTRYVMARCPFDDDALPLSPPLARRLLSDAGFRIMRTDFLFIFPRTLRCLRPLEALVARYPLGAQYQILARKE